MPGKRSTSLVPSSALPAQQPAQVLPSPRPIRVSLALGSGGARGYAHIGALQVLDERSIEVAAIAGSSMGALIGGLYAAGKLDDYREWAVGLRQVDVLRLLDLAITAPGVLRAEKIFGRVRDMLGDVRIEDLRLPFTAVATDLIAQREVWFQRGSLEVALRASVALPGIFPPVMLNGRLLVDGGLMNPIPVAPTMAAEVDATIAISLAGDPRDPSSNAPTQETSDLRPTEEWAERFRRGASTLLDSDMATSLMARFGSATGRGPGAGGGPAAAAADAAESALEALPSGLTKMAVMNQSLEAMQGLVTRYRLASFPPDVLIAIPKDSCRTMDYHRAEAMIETGRALTIEALDRAGLGAPPAAGE